MAAARRERRNGLELDQRVSLLEDDHDDFERRIAQDVEKLRREMHKMDADAEIRDARMGDRISKMQSLMVGMIISLATAAVLLSINLAISGFTK